MGLFDRLFGKKEKTEKVLPISEEVTENKEQEVADTEEPKVVSQDRDEQKISDMEAYYQELKERIAATHQPVSTVTQEESSEEPLVEEKESVEASEGQAPVEEITEVATPAEPVEEITEVAIPAELAEEIAEVEAPAEPAEETTEEVVSAEPVEAITEFVATPDSSEAPTEVEIPAEPAEEIAEEAEEITEEAAPAEPVEAITEVVAPVEPAEEPVEVEEPVVEPVVEAPDQEAQSEVAPQQETIQEKYDRSLKKTRTGLGARLNAFFANFRSVDEEFFEELEELLIMSDVGVQVASNLTEELRYEARLENAKKPDALKRVIIEKLVDLYEKDGQFNEAIQFQEDLTVMLFVGVNGVGKTTSIGKLAHKYKQEGKKVLLDAADNFRAGSVAQLV